MDIAQPKVQFHSGTSALSVRKQFAQRTSIMNRMFHNLRAHFHTQTNVGASIGHSSRSWHRDSNVHASANLQMSNLYKR